MLPGELRTGMRLKLEPHRGIQQFPQDVGAGSVRVLRTKPESRMLLQGLSKWLQVTRITDQAKPFVWPLAVDAIAGLDSGSEPILWKMVVRSGWPASKGAEHPPARVAAPHRIGVQNDSGWRRNTGFHLISIKLSLTHYKSKSILMRI